MNIILATLCAHMISDFILQTDKTVEEKSKLLYKGIFKHFFEVLIPLYIIMQLQFVFIDALLYSIVISIIHIAIDILKIIIQKKCHIKSNWQPFIMDQAIHIIIVVIIVLGINLNFMYNQYFSVMLPTFRTTFLSDPSISIHSIIIKCELYGIIYILFGLGAGIFIGNFLKPFKPENQDDKPLKAGKYIGIFERFVIITLTILAQYSAIAFIVAAKSLARHEDLNKRGFAEYYLLGTLLSIFIAIIGGLLLNYLMQIIV